MGYWKERCVESEEQLTNLRNETANRVFELDRMRVKLSDAQTGLAAEEAVSTARLDVLASYKRQTEAFRTSSMRLTSRNSVLHVENIALVAKLKQEEIRLTPVLPPLPERVLVRCTRMHGSFNDIEAGASLRRENVRLQGAVDRLRNANQHLVHQVNGSNTRVKEIHNMLLDVKYFVDALDREKYTGPAGPAGSTGA